MDKLKRTYSLEKRIVELVERLARETKRDYSSIVELAVEEYAQNKLQEKKEQPVR